jgi:hypothetical protein
MSRLIGFVSCGLEEVVALDFVEQVAHVAYGLPKLIVGSCSSASDQGLELFEKAISMGFRSGLYGGRNRNQAPISRRVRVAPGLLWLDRLSRITTSPARSVRASWVST